MTTEAPQNQTLLSRLVVPLAEVQPIPGHDLVIFARSRNGGYRYHATVGPEERVQGHLLGRWMGLTSFVGFGVLRIEDLRRDVEREVTTHDQAERFRLRCRLTLRTRDPRLLVEHLSQDPLGLVETNAIDVFARAISRVNWLDIERQGVHFEDQLQRSVSHQADKGGVTNLRAVQEFAERRGLEVREVDLSVVFSPEYGEVIRRTREEQRKRAILVETGKTANLEASQEGLRSLVVSAGSNLERVLANISDGITSPATLRSVIGELMDLFGQVRQLTGSAVGAAEGGTELLREKVLALVPSGTLTESRSWSGRLADILAVVESLGCPESDRRELVASILALYSEQALEAEADPARLQGARERVRACLGRVLPSVTQLEVHEKLVGLLRAELTIPPAASQGAA